MENRNREVRDNRENLETKVNRNEKYRQIIIILILVVNDGGLEFGEGKV